jgi:type IV pilus assembly protein PilY1
MIRRATLLKSVLVPASLLLALMVQARTPLMISAEPLGTSTGVSIKPNLWLILDNSGSMDWTFTPDWVDDSICQSNMSSLGAGTYGCDVGDVPYMAAGFNKSYYNPAIIYPAPFKADGTSMGDASPTAALAEPFRYPTASTAATTGCYSSSVSGGNYKCNLTTKFPHSTWCKSDGSSCLENTNSEIAAAARPYAFPGSRGASAGDTSARTNPGNTTYGAPYYFVMTGSPSWCTSSALTVCPSPKWTKAISRTASTPAIPAYSYPNFNAAAKIDGVPSSATLTINSLTASSGKITKLTNGSSDAPTGKATIFSGTITVPPGGDNCPNRNNFANSVAAAVGNGYTATVVAGVGTPSSGSTWNAGGTCKPVIIIKAPGSTTTATNTAYNGSFTVTKSNVSTSTTSFSGAVDYSPAHSAVAFTRVDIVPATASYAYYATRSCSQVAAGVTAGGCCAGAASCTYAEELQNFANWYSYYRGRMLMMKSALASAFNGVSDTAPGIGFRVGFTTINNPADVAIADFTSAQKTAWYTKLFGVVPGNSTPLRTALSRAGRIYQGTVTVGSDPVQYSCQQNYTFLATDGYWNTDTAGTDFTAVGDVDGSANNPANAIPNPPYKDAQAQSNTLADIARYFYVTDLRPTMTDDVPKSSGDELHAGNSLMHQHMKTFTMGLGIDGYLAYSPAYRSGGSADYQAILTGAKDWGVPAADSPTAIDDLWHAAVNGHGVYFSASDPTDVAAGLAQTLGAAQQETGASAAAATSNLEPVAGDNFAYVASYTTSSWDGNLEAKSIDLATGAISDAASADIWQAQGQLDTLAAAGTRKLVTATAAGGQRNLTWANLSPTEQGYFSPTQIVSCNPVALCPGATAQNLFDFVMGGADTTTSGSYRLRTHVLGDIVSSQPVYVRGSKFNYYDAGYDAYKTATEARVGMVYVGANDGFLHAFDAIAGSESWAYAPLSLLPKLYKLADPSYQHQYYVDGTLTIGDANISGWKTILVGGMNAGGTGYFALDVTTPGSPTVLWEFTDANMGNTYGNPVITKLPDGTWVVVVTSGYDNCSRPAIPSNPKVAADYCALSGSGDGRGYLYVLDAGTGALKFKISTGSGSNANPSGLAKIANWVDDPSGDNTTRYVYGGDLNGDLWRFDLVDKTALKLIGVGTPITAKPELAAVNYKRTVFFGTGLFLEAAQKDPGNNVGNAIYGVRDDDAASSLLAADLVDIPLATFTTSDGITESQWTTNHGWVLNLGSGYFVNVDPKIQLSTLAVASNHVAAADGNAGTSCTAAKGDNVVYFINFATGAGVRDSSHPAVVSGTSLIVGINIVRLPDGKLKLITTTSDNKHVTDDVAVASGTSKARRISWRELTTN